MKYLGIDIGGTSVKMGIVDSNFNVLYSDAYDVYFDNYKTPIFVTVLKSIDLFLKQSNTSIDEIKKIGVSTMGQIDSNKGIVVSTAGHVGAYDGTDIRGELYAKYGKPVFVLNDANAAALGEGTVGGMRDISNYVMLVVGTGIGAGAVINGHILNGHFGFAGEIGHVTIKKDGAVCSCGNIGCFERIASTLALVKRVEARAELRSKFGDEVNGKLIFDLYEDGDKDIEKEVDEWMFDVAIGIVTVIHIFNPQAIVIGGAISKRQIFIDKVMDKIRELSMPRFLDEFVLLPAELGNNAGLVGAVKFAMMN